MGARLLVVTVAVLCVAGVAVAPAFAGTWMQVSCANPDGSPAPSEGWSGGITGTPSVGSENDSQCSPGSPMTVSVSAIQPDPSGAGEYLRFAPPEGSRLIGGTVSLVARADGGSAYGNAFVGLYEPAMIEDPSDRVFACVQGYTQCAGGQDYSGPVTLPSDRGGQLYLWAQCGSLGGPGCDRGGSGGLWAEGEISRAQLLLANDAVPQASGFGGSALQGGARGTAHLVFTASDTGGPGIYAVAVAIDGRAVWSGTPNVNGGKCVSRGTDAATGATMFDNQQPCPVTEVVDAPVSTSGLPDGRHRLTVAVGDAAGNVSDVVDRRITTSNPQHTPVQRRGVRAQFVISWRWLHRHTTLRSVNVRRLPRSAHIAVRCSGRGCPRLKVTSVSARHVRRLLRALRGRRFTVGDTLLITVTAPHRRGERVRLTFRDNRMPRARLVR